MQMVVHQSKKNAITEKVSAKVLEKCPECRK